MRQAERQVAAQSAQIGVALTDFFPSIAINGEIYQASENFDDLFRSASAAGAIGPSFRWNILNYGRIADNVWLQDARLLELIANYQNTVLLANQEVEDALVAFQMAQQEVDSLRESVDDLDESLKLLLIQFEEGKTDFSTIFVLQGSLRSAQDQLAAAEGQVLINKIAGYRALGGGWQIRCPEFQPQVSTVGDLPEDIPMELLPVPVGESVDTEKQERNQLPALDEGPIEDSEDD